MEDILRGLSRFSTALGAMACVLMLYWLGPIYWIFQLVPLLSVLPMMIVLSEILRRLVEWQLGKAQVAVGNDAVLITGCDSGFGQMLAKRLVDKGYKVFAGCLFPEGDGAAQLREYSDQIHVIPINVTSCESLKQAKDAVQQELQAKGSALWAVVANAGIAQQGPLEWTSMDEVKQIFDVNTFGVIRTIKTFLPLVRKSKGRVVVTSSLLATIANPCVVPYSMSKAAVKNLTEGLQRELGTFGVYCSSIEPTYYATNIVRDRALTDYERKFNALDEDMKRDYGGYMDLCRKYYETIVDVITSSNLEEPLSAFEHAVCSSRPRPYYTVDSPLLSFWREILKHFCIEIADMVVYLMQFLGPISKRIGLR